jgi:hypothetical protein
MITGYKSVLTGTGILSSNGAGRRGHDCTAGGTAVVERAKYLYPADCYDSTRPVTNPVLVESTARFMLGNARGKLETAGDC